MKEILIYQLLEIRQRNLRWLSLKIINGTVLGKYNDYAYSFIAMLELEKR